MAGRYRIVVAVLLFLVGMINYMDRAAIGILAPSVTADLHLSSSQLGLVFSAFFFSYAFFAFFGGYFSDRFGPRRTFFFAALSWSIFCALTGAVSGLWGLIAVRLCFGASEGPMNSTTNRMVTNWFPREECSRALGFSLSGQNFGSALASPLVIFAGYEFGWRASFLALGVLGIIWSFFWFRYVTDLPQNSARVTSAELEKITFDANPTRLTPKSESGGLLSLLMNRTTMALAFGLFALLYPLYIFVSWLPSYFTTVLHVTPRELSIAAAIPWLGGFLGYAGGGVVSDYVFKKMNDGLSARKLTTVVPLLISSAILVCLPMANDVVTAVFICFCALTMLSMGTQSLWTILREVIPQNQIGTAGGFVHFLANMSGVVAPAVTGYAMDHGGGYQLAFVIASVVGFAGAIVLIASIRTRSGGTVIAQQVSGPAT